MIAQSLGLAIVPDMTDHRTSPAILGLGTLVVDHVMLLPGALRPDGKHEATAHLHQVGGPVPTALVLLRRWGWTAGFLGAWGDDAHGAFIAADLQREGVDLRWANTVLGGRTGFAHVWVDTVSRTRTIAYHRGTCGDHAPSPAVIDWAGVRLLHLDGRPREPALTLAREAKRRGLLVSLDAGSAKPGFDSLLPEVDLLNASASFASAYTDTTEPAAAARALRRLGPSWVTVTRGGDGAVMACPEGLFEQSAFPVEAVDTTGAGDVFCGAMLHGRLSGWSPARSLRTACAAAALKCTGLGNRNSLPNLEAVASVASCPMPPNPPPPARGSPKNP